MDIDSWLRKLGLGQYEAAFRDNAIDEKVLPRLTAEDLKDLGVGLVGHRRTLLDAIAALRGDANAKEPPSEALPHAPASSQASAPPATVAPTAEAVGERRYLTVMFCDLVGSTGISAQLDAEEWRDLVGAYLDAASAAVTEMGGHVAKKLGDGLMALFGYPVAHENDAERAARAALAIQRALAELNRKNEGIGKPVLTARIGLESGPAVLDAAGEIYGDVANIAARVQALAEPGAVLVTARVQRQVAGLFVAEERGTHTLKGVPEPSALFKLVRASGGGRRSEQRNLTPLVGRADEMATLVRRWDRARQGDGQLVMIVGEPGLGKSRLLEEFRARLADTPHTWVECEIVNGIFYVMRSGCAWRLMPNNLPPWGTIYRWFAVWRDDGRFERINHALVMADRERVRSATPAPPWRSSIARAPRPPRPAGHAVTMLERRSTDVSAMRS